MATMVLSMVLLLLPALADCRSEDGDWSIRSLTDCAMCFLISSLFSSILPSHSAAVLHFAIAGHVLGKTDDTNVLMMGCFCRFHVSSTMVFLFTLCQYKVGSNLMCMRFGIRASHVSS